MPTSPVPRITQWSFSRWRDYEHCPALAKYKYVEKRKEPDSPAMKRGTDIHKAAEVWLGADKKLALPDSLALFEKEFNGLRRLKAIPEVEWAFTESWEPTGWFDTDCWVRIKADAFAIRAGKMGQIIDFKTGKERENHPVQLSLYAIGALTKYPDIMVADTQLWYLDLGKLGGEIFARSTLDDLKAEWKMRTRPMLNDTIFAPRPNESCRWCHFRKANGGPCQY